MIEFKSFIGRVLLDPTDILNVTELVPEHRDRYKWLEDRTKGPMESLFANPSKADATTSKIAFLCEAGVQYQIHMKSGAQFHVTEPYEDVRARVLQARKVLVTVPELAETAGAEE